MGAVILDRAIIGNNCLVAAGSLVPPGKTFPDGSLILGSPATVVRTLTEAEKEHIIKNARDYYDLWQGYYKS